ncbi:hypothetical protein HUS71_25640, partial [Pandoraea nosoerga]|nr:hypothetical protein [Pandoraea nosoerga]
MSTIAETTPSSSAFSSEVDTGSREENASKQESQPEQPLRDVVVGDGYHTVLVVALVDQQGVH